MRIITGKYRSKKLFYPSNNRFRPTQDKVKESIFNILGPKGCLDLDVLDLFAGTGSLGIEAYSRGANSVICVDRKDQYVKKNISLLEDFQDGKFIKSVCCTVSAYLSTSDLSFDIIFMDPPWSDEKAYSNSLKQILASGIIRTNGVLFCLHRKSFKLPVENEWQQTLRNYGDANVSVLRPIHLSEG